MKMISGEKEIPVSWEESTDIILIVGGIRKHYPPDTLIDDIVEFQNASEIILPMPTNSITFECATFIPSLEYNVEVRATATQDALRDTRSDTSITDLTVKDGMYTIKCSRAYNSKFLRKYFKYLTFYEISVYLPPYFFDKDRYNIVRRSSEAEREYWRCHYGVYSALHSAKEYADMKFNNDYEFVI